MKNLFLHLILLFSCWLMTAQFGPQQIITTNANNARKAIPLDVDSDGFIDVISASYSDAKIAWYKNIDGLGDFSNEHIITDEALAIENVEIYDLNGDDNIDIVYKTNLNKIAWLENLDGQGNFGSEQIIEDINYPYHFLASDFDGDGDLDILAFLFNNSVSFKLVWYKNLDGLGNFSSEIIIGDISSNFFMDIEMFDLDNDGDQDIITAYEIGPSKLIWLENLDGFGNFDTEKEIYQFQYSPSWTVINSISSSDFNNDGKIDLLIDTIFDEPLEEHIYWLENLDNQGSFGLPQLISNDYTASGSLYPFDIDNDGDIDVLAALYESNHLENSTIAWYSNEDGLGNFGAKQIISTEVVRATDATAADINGDGKIDVISASSYDNKIAWYENEVLGIEDHTEHQSFLYPNPTHGKLQIHANQEIILIEIYNLVGQKVLETKSEINLSNFVSGIYFVKIKDSNGFSEVHKIIKE